MIHDDPLRTEIHAALDEISQPPPDLAPASMARIRRTPAPHRQLMPALRAAGVLALAAIVGGIVFASHQASGNRRPATNSRPVAPTAQPKAIDPSSCRLPVLIMREAGPPNPEANNEGGFVDTRTGQYRADPAASIAGLPGGAFAGTIVKPPQPARVQSYSVALNRWLPVRGPMVAPDGRSYIWIRFLPPGSNGSTFKTQELHRFDVATKTDQLLWTYPGFIDIVRWDSRGILLDTSPPPPDGGASLWWLVDPLTGGAVQEAGVSEPAQLTELPGDRVNGGFGYGSFGMDAQGRTIYRIGSRQSGDREWVFYESAPGQRVTIYKGTQGDATGFDPMDIYADATGLWFGDYDNPTIWHWSVASGLRKITVTGTPAAIAGHGNSYVFVNPAGPCL